MLMAMVISNVSMAQIDTGDAADEAITQLEQLKPFLEILCGLGIVSALIYGGFKWTSDNTDKQKLIGTVVGVIILLGIAYWAIDQTL